MQKYYLRRKETCLGPHSLKYIGPKIWSDIPENLKSPSPYYIKNNMKTPCYLQFVLIFVHMLVTFVQYCFDTPLFPNIFYLFSCAPHPLHIGKLFTYCFSVVVFVHLFYLTLIRCILQLFFHYLRSASN